MLRLAKSEAQQVLYGWFLAVEMVFVSFVSSWTTRLRQAKAAIERLNKKQLDDF